MFSLNWFLTPAGIFITLGVLLLVAALVIFLVTKNKGKKDKEKSGVDNMANAALNAAPPVDASGMAVPTAPGPVVAPIDNTQVVQPTMDMQQPIVDNQVAVSTEMPSMDGMSQMVDNSGMTQQVEVPNVYSNDSITDLSSAQPQAAVPSSDEIPTIEGISMEVPQVELPDSVNQVADTSIQVEQPAVEVPNVYSNEVVNNADVSNDVNSYAAPAVDNGTIGVPTVEQAMPEIEGVSMPVNEQPVATPDTATSIYGGASPAALPDFNQAPAQPQIYGGANPLENTQQVPIADITNNNVVQNNAVPTTPVVEQPSAVAAPVTPNEANVAAVTAVQNPVQDYTSTNNFQNVGNVNNGQAYSASNAQAQIPTQNNNIIQ